MHAGCSSRRPAPETVGHTAPPPSHPTPPPPAATVPFPAPCPFHAYVPPLAEHGCALRSPHRNGLTHRFFSAVITLHTIVAARFWPPVNRRTVAENPFFDVFFTGHQRTRRELCPTTFLAHALPFWVEGEGAASFFARSHSCLSYVCLTPAQVASHLIFRALAVEHAQHKSTARQGHSQVPCVLAMWLVCIRQFRRGSQPSFL